MVQRVRERQWNKKNKLGMPASYQEGDWVLVHHSRLPAWPRPTSDDPYFGPYKILSVDGHRITVRCSPRLGGTLVCAAQQVKRYYDPEDLCGEEWELNDEEIAAVDCLQNILMALYLYELVPTKALRAITLSKGHARSQIVACQASRSTRDKLHQFEITRKRKRITIINIYVFKSANIAVLGLILHPPDRKLE